MAIGRIPEPGTGIPESIVDAKGDIVTATAADTPARIAVGANETRLVADSAAATGLKYVADTTNYAVAAKGDLLVGTAADTVAPLTVGANGTTLVADSAEATGLKWATPSGGGGMTSIASGSLSGGSLSLTSISGSYKNLQLVLRDYQHSGDTALGFTVNSVTSYEYVGIDATQNYQQIIYAQGADIELTRYNAKSGDDNNALVITLNDYANTTANKQVDSLNTYKNDRATNPDAITKIWGVAVTTSAITSITITAKSNNFNGGTYILYGVS